MLNLKREAKFQIKWRYLVVAIAITPIAIILAFISTGAGHGNYFFCKLFFSFTMLSAHFFDDTITIPFVILAFIQIPVYGIFLMFSFKKYIRILVVLHSVAVCLCFLIPMYNFPKSICNRKKWNSKVILC